MVKIGDDSGVRFSIEGRPIEEAPHDGTIVLVLYDEKVEGDEKYEELAKQFYRGGRGIGLAKYVAEVGHWGQVEHPTPDYWILIDGPYSDHLINPIAWVPLPESWDKYLKATK